MTDELEPDVATVFDDFWREIVMPNGEWDLDQVKRELHDYHTCITEVPKVYMEITGHLMSKPNYLASEVIGVHEERCPFRSDLREMVRRIKRIMLGLDQAAYIGDDASILVGIEEVMNDYVDVDECLNP